MRLRSMPLTTWLLIAAACSGTAGVSAEPSDSASGNRLVDPNGVNPYCVGRDAPRLTTPQWFGEPGVEAVVILAIDDMRGHEKWEAFLRPILERLKAIDGRGAVSIMTNQIDPAQPHLQTWLREGVSLECHTFDHPCPLLREGDFAKAKGTYDRSVDLMNAIPGSRAVAFRMPCCDSLNTVSPRFFSEIFNRRTPQGSFLAIDSSVFNVTTPNDPALPRELVLDADGRERFRKYLPFPSFVNTIEDYPYPYVIGGLCWEFPCVVPSDWEAQNILKPNNPRAVDDLQGAIDCSVIKQGVFTLVFHPHGWIRNDQVVALIEHAVRHHGGKIRFLNFREAAERISRNLLGGQTLRAADGSDNGVRLMDLNADGFLDVVIANEQVRQTRLWVPGENRWAVGEFPLSIVSAAERAEPRCAAAQFGIVGTNRAVSLIVRTETNSGGWQFDGQAWRENPQLLRGLEIDGQPVLTSAAGRDQGVRLHDLDGDGQCELLVSNPRQNGVFVHRDGWQLLPWRLPQGATRVDAQGRDDGLRFVDVDEDLHDDLVFSNERELGLFLFESLEKGWARQVFREARRESDRLPMFSRAGTDNGAWVHSRHIWVQNEDTARMPDLVDRRSFRELLDGITPRPKSPSAALASMRPRPGFAVELVAAEPLLTDPVHFDWGADGKLWVVEMADYPSGIDEQHSPGGRVRCLEDSDGDGSYDRSTVFLEGLRYPTSVMSWGRGVLVTAAPELFYAEDSDGDGKADRRDTLFAGFAAGNPQHVVNGLAWGLDNWVYGANGDSGGRVKSLRTGETVAIGGRDFRCRPDDGRFEAASGYTQFVRSRDDWGNWFGSSNSNPMWQYVLEDHYLRRNPHYSAPDGRWTLSDMPGQSPVYPLSRTLERFNDPHTENCFTSACSAIIYRDELFGPMFAGNSFVSEPVHNLVHREIIRPDGVRFRSRRADDEMKSEFLASTDCFFRPTTIRTGPDGALWIADMYRLVIEHPEWIPKSMQANWDLRAGSDRGRIYRVYPVGAKPRPLPRLDKLSPAELVAQLESPNGWIRDKAQQLLVASRGADSVSALAALARGGKRATARLHALCTLEGLQAVDRLVLLAALADEHQGVRRHAVRIAESLAGSDEEVAARLCAMTGDADPAVRLQLAYSLGAWTSREAGLALGRLAVADAADPYVSAAAMSSALPNLAAVAEAVMDSDADRAALVKLIANLVAIGAATGNDEALFELVPRVAARQPDGGFAVWQLEAVGELLDSLDRQQSTLAEFHDKSTPRLQPEIDKLGEMFGYARAIASDGNLPAARRLPAIRLLGRGASGVAEDLETLAALLAPQHPSEAQQAAGAELGRLRDPAVARILLAGWGQFGPSMQPVVLDILFSREVWLEQCLDALEAERLPAAGVDAAHRQQLLDHRSAEVRKRAEKLLAGGDPASRQKLIDQFRASVGSGGSAEHGKEVFARHCAVCHRIGDAGHAIGPDVVALTDRSSEALLVAILDPNRAVEAKFANYTATTKSGLTYTGLVAAETATSVTLLGQESKQQVLLRSEIDALASSGKSLMPEGLEKDLTAGDLADVIAYVQTIGRQPKAIPGNRPAVVQPEPLRQWVFCLANNGEIFGQTLRLEEVNGALGYWNSADDQATWTIDIPRDQRYTVWLDIACPESAAGNTWLVEVDDYRLSGRVQATASWNAYQRQKAGEVRLPAGRHRLGVRAQGPIREALFDLKAVVLIPIAGG